MDGFQVEMLVDLLKCFQYFYSGIAWSALKIKDISATIRYISLFYCNKGVNSAYSSITKCALFMVEMRYILKR